jgi:CRP-like cAMP-binding protein
MDKDFKKLLENEAGGVKLSEELFQRIIDKMVEIRLKDKEAFILYGKVNTSLYIQKTGISRAYHFDGENERTYGFAEPGTVLMSYYSLFVHKPAIIQMESCGESVVLKMSKKALDELIDSSSEFARWFVAIQFAQLSIYEFRHAFMDERPEDRYIWTLKNRPEILERVSSKILASYIGVTPSYFSYLKRTLWKNK